jgi:hypothetical protein
MSKIKIILSDVRRGPDRPSRDAVTSVREGNPNECE